jgi:predicted RNA-binding Zn-ribbon protein involved in translation (DUF1610 family)
VQCRNDRTGEIEAISAGAALQSTAFRIYSYLVPYQIPCPKCDQAGFVRMEHVITGVKASKAYFCGKCEYEWHVLDQLTDSPAVIKGRRRPRTINIGPKRRS